MTTAPTLAAMPAAAAFAVDMHRPLTERFFQAIDPRRMQEPLAAALGRPGGSCYVLDAKFEPGVRATVLYEYDGRLVRGDVVEGGAELSGRQVVGPGVRVSVFPDDPDLPGLEHVLDPATMAAALETLVPSPTGAAARRRRRPRVTLLRYRPEKRATVLVTAGHGQPRYIAKTYHDAVKAAAAADEATALAALTVPGRALRLAPTLGSLPHLDTVVSGVVTGTPLDAILGSTRPDAPRTRQALLVAAQALAQLHDTAHTARRQRPVDKELQRFGSRAAGVATVDPQLGEELAALAARLIEVQRFLPGPIHGTVHGDCKPSQFLVSATHAYLLDLDHVGVADQATDVGTFLATLRQHAVRHRLSRHRRSPADAAAVAAIFLENYLDHRIPGAVDVARIRWHEAVALERKALRAFARAPRSPLPAALVAAANTCLDTLMVEET
jgi:hypothetical protein